MKQEKRQKREKDKAETIEVALQLRVNHVTALHNERKFTNSFDHTCRGEFHLFRKHARTFYFDARARAAYAQLEYALKRHEFQRLTVPNK